MLKKKKKQKPKNASLFVYPQLKSTFEAERAFPFVARFVVRHYHNLGENLADFSPLEDSVPILKK